MIYNYKKHIWMIGLIIILLLINQWIKIRSLKEGFSSSDFGGLKPEFTSIDTLEASFKPVPGFVPWPKDLIQRFKIYQKSVSKNVKQYNMYVLQQQATAEEAEILLNTGYWPWPEDLKDEYIKAVWQNPIIKIDPKLALQNAQEIYCKSLLYLLSLNGTAVLVLPMTERSFIL